MEQSISNSWLLVSLLAIFFFLYQWVVIYTVVTVACTPLEEFWLAPDQLALNPFNTFTIGFGLFGVWALTEVVAAQMGSYPDKWFCTGVCSLVLVCVIATLTTFKAHWEYYEVQRGLRDHDELTLQAFETPEKQYISPWNEFLNRKRCEAPESFRGRHSEAFWRDLRREFIDGGGSFDSVEIGN